jgi:hypothetical protein
MGVIPPGVQRYTCLLCIIFPLVNHFYRVLDSMHPQELCSSTLESIVEGSCIECLYFQLKFTKTFII